jgi:hypothetical protein
MGSDMGVMRLCAEKVQDTHVGAPAQPSCEWYRQSVHLWLYLRSAEREVLPPIVQQPASHPVRDPRGGGTATIKPPVDTMYRLQYKACIYEQEAT